jgi:hypothetical protein
MKPTSISQWPGGGTKLRDLIAADEGAHLRTWWERLEALAPALAREAGDILFYTQEEANRVYIEIIDSNGDDEGFRYYTGVLDWVTRARSASDFVSLISPALYDEAYARLSQTKVLERALARGIEENDQAKVHASHALSIVLKQDSLTSLEDALGISLGDAYAEAGERKPLILHLEDDGYHVEVRHDTLSIVRFIEKCIAGFESGHPAWRELTYRLVVAHLGSAGM